MKKILTWFDPHRQSFFFFRWNIGVMILILILSALLTYYWKSSFVNTLLNNIFVYAPNYLTHEILGHNLVGNIFYRALYSSHRELGAWIATLAGNGVETLVPFIAACLVLNLEGGRWAMPPLLYWLASTFYGAGEYAADARACSLPLTSSDMLTTYKPGERCGDWHDILGAIGWLEYDQIVAYTFLFIGSLLFVLALYSAWYYWTHSDFISSGPDPLPKPDDSWQPPNIYNP